MPNGSNTLPSSPSRSATSSCGLCDGLITSAIGQAPPSSFHSRVVSYPVSGSIHVSRPGESWYELAGSGFSTGATAEFGAEFEPGPAQPDNRPETSMQATAARRHAFMMSAIDTAPPASTHRHTVIVWEQDPAEGASSEGLNNCTSSARPASRRGRRTVNQAELRSATQSGRCVFDAPPAGNHGKFLLVAVPHAGGRAAAVALQADRKSV